MEEKEVEKREKGKSGFGKSPFCFCLTVCLPLPFFSLYPPHHQTTTYAHTHPPPTTQHDLLVHTITCKQDRVLCCLFPFSLHSPRHNTRSHSPHTIYNMTHWCTPSHANRAVCCAAFFWEWTARHTLHHPHPTLHHLTSHNTHQPTQHRHSSLCKQQ